MKRRHTKRDLVKIFKQRGLRANRLLGQNFLVDHNVLDFICRAGDVSADDVVLEIGAGTGLLTEHLARAGAEVVAVEIDRNLFQIACEYVGDPGNVLMLCCDIHGKRQRINPDVQAALEKTVAPGMRLKVISNLPYCISSDLLVSLLEMQLEAGWPGASPVERMVLTVQREFGGRLLARSGTRDYSPLTVLLRAQAEVKRLKNLPPSVFWPVPRVGSSIIRIAPDAERRSQIADYARLKAVVKALFSQRRKTTVSALRGLAPRRLSNADITAALQAAGVSPNARADGLRVSEIMALSNKIL